MTFLHWVFEGEEQALGNSDRHWLASAYARPTLSNPVLFGQIWAWDNCCHLYLASVHFGAVKTVYRDLKAAMNGADRKWREFNHVATTIGRPVVCHERAIEKLNSLSAL